ncbi:FAD binding domain-containing protein [Penicillium verhagenii]|uniref:FAD binding domain-containing protein n=1 Tax=Penicillium verhagenii TaxID=1562060 RepID=UPI002545AAFB|nr:FAD binding domain-containing protein [Penicillium verhagenii]KAJ5934037.1 FAD binding domain-containing protein [Penicillium verhagenii]
MAEEIEIPVIIVGGGGCGLTLSAFLSNYGVEHVLLEKHTGTSILPKAHYLNQRTMETLRNQDMVEKILQKTCPPRHMSQVAWQTSLGGSGPFDRQVISKFECFGGHDGHDAPLRSGNLPLFRLEPILKQIAEQRNPDKVLFGHRLMDFTDKGSYVLVRASDEGGIERTYRCKYLIAADGGRTIGPKLGIKMEGLTNITDMVSVHFSANLSEYWDDRYFACHLINGECNTVFESGAIVPMGPNWGKHSKEWVFHCGFAMDDQSRHNDMALIPRIRQLLKIPDLEMDVHKVSHWAIEKVLADRYRVGRVFLAGDAGNRRPPTTGLGLNTAIEDSLNIAWKLAMVLKGQASESILDSYEEERRSVGKINCDWGLFTFSNSAVINTALGLIPGEREANQVRFHSLFEDTDKGHSFRAQVARIIDSQAIEFCAHGIELGFRYTKGILLHDGSLPIERDPLGLKYYPTTQPGHRLPHAWIETGNSVISTHDLVPKRPGFALITDSEGGDWAIAAHNIAKNRGVEVAVAQIGDKALYRDYDDRWNGLKGIQTGGAILVRPDNMIAWRSIYKSCLEGKELETAMDQLLLGVREENSKAKL